MISFSTPAFLARSSTSSKSSRSIWRLGTHVMDGYRVYLDEPFCLGIHLETWGPSDWCQCLFVMLLCWLKQCDLSIFFLCTYETHSFQNWGAEERRKHSFDFILKFTPFIKRRGFKCFKSGSNCVSVGWLCGNVTYQCHQSSHEPIIMFGKITVWITCDFTEEVAPEGK